MRVGYDEQAFLAQRRGGVSRYFARLFCELRQAPDLGVEPLPGWKVAPNEHLEAERLTRRGPLTRPRAGRDFDPLVSGLAYAVNTSARRRLAGVDLVHHTFYHPRFLGVGRGRLKATTVHDMIPELFPELFSRDPHLAKREYVRRSDLVLCVSEATRQDLMTAYGKVDARVEVVHLGVDLRFRPGLARLPEMPERYILFVGKRGAYKDFPVVVRALSDRALAGVPLVAIGGGAFTTDEHDLLRRTGVAARVRQHDVSEADLPHWFACATAFVFPSRYEGFGLPTLEAMASGCPTVLARASSLPEVGGEAAVYVEPGDEAGIAHVLAELWDDDARRRAMARAGVTRAAQFPWRATAAATATAYRSLLD